MDNILTFIKVLFLSKVLLVTPNPINIEKEKNINLTEGISAITEGAHIEIDVSSMLQNDNVDIITIKDIVSKTFPPESIKAILKSNEHSETVQLVYKGAVSWGGKEDIKIILSALNGVPTGMKFNNVLLETRIPLKDVKIYWNNYSK